MNPKTIGIFAVVTAAFVVAATFSGRVRESATAAGAGGGKLFPSLIDQINDARRVTVGTAEASFTLERAESGWGLAEKNGYPVDDGKVKKLLLALSDTALLERKTSRPEHYDRLGVEPVDAEDAASSRLTVEGAGGVLADVIVGSRRAAQGATPSPQYYVRKPDEAQSWLAEGDLAIDGTQSGWLSKDILDVSRERLRAARIEHADGEVVFCYQPTQDAENWELADIPEGKQLRYASAAGSLASALSRLSLNDVMAAGDVELDEATRATSTFWTWDGLRVTVTTHVASEQGEEDVPGAETLYATFDVAYDDTPPPGVPAPSEATEEETSPIDADDDAVVSGLDDEPEELSPAQVQEQAREIQERAASWVYVLPSWKKSTFAKRKDELIQDIPPPAEPIEPNPDLLEGGEVPSLQDALDDAQEGIEELQEEASEALEELGEALDDGHAGHDHGDEDGR